MEEKIRKEVVVAKIKEMVEKMDDKEYKEFIERLKVAVKKIINPTPLDR